MAGVRKALLILACSAIAAGYAAQAAPRTAGPDRAPATEKPAVTLKPVLDPSNYAGMASMGYASAKAAPEVMSKVFCYCGCDVSDSHAALLDCFTSEHGMDCHICQEEAILALRLHRDGASVGEIQHKIDSDFGSKYPFDTKSEALKKYEASRLTASSAGGSNASAASSSAEADCAVPAKGKKQKMKLKPGAKAGSCCGAHDEHSK